MRAKFNNGRCDQRSSRILFVVDMAIRGMNNWPVLFLVDQDRSRSVNVLVQFKGRDHRLSRLSDRFNDPHFQEFCTGRYYYSASDRPGDKSYMRDAIDFILDMDTKLQEANFLQWSDLVGGTRRDLKPNPQPDEMPFSRDDRLQVDAALGIIKRDGREPTIDEVETLIESLPGTEFDPNAGRSWRAREHVAKVLGANERDREYRRGMVAITVEDVIKAIKDEKPKAAKDYTDEELIAFICEDHKFSSVKEDAVKKLNDPTFRHVVAEEKHEHDLKFYRPVPKLLQLQKAEGRPGLISSIGNSQVSQLLSRELIGKKSIGRVYQAVNLACGIVFGIEEKGIAENGSKLDRPGYHHMLCLPHTQKLIKDIASALLIRWRIINDVSELYADVIDEAESTADAAE